MVTHLILIRHAEIPANVEHRWHGTTDSDLTPDGESQIALLKASKFDQYPLISKVYCSPLKRTLRTAIAAADHARLEPEIDHDLIEYGVGDYEGLRYDELHERYDFFTKIAGDFDYAPPGGESVNAVLQRMLRAYKRLLENHQGECIAWVGHGAAFGILLSWLIRNEPLPFHDYQLSNTGIAHLQIQSGDEAVAELQVFNERGHLGL